jgi:hypothetical protein
VKKWDAQGAAERWKKAYLSRHGIWNGPNREAIYGEIVAADGDPDKINAAIGNESWTEFHCAECDTHQSQGAEFDNWDGGIVVVCVNCLKASLSLFGFEAIK